MPADVTRRFLLDRLLFRRRMRFPPISVVTACSRVSCDFVRLSRHVRATNPNFIIILIVERHVALFTFLVEKADERRGEMMMRCSASTAILRTRLGFTVEMFSFFLSICYQKYI